MLSIYPSKSSLIQHSCGYIDREFDMSVDSHKSSSVRGKREHHRECMGWEGKETQVHDYLVTPTGKQKLHCADLNPKH